jgi:hypothetical protein
MVRSALSGLASLTLALIAVPVLGITDAAHAVTCTATTRLDGSFIQPALPDSWTNTQLANEMTYLGAACMDTQVLQWTADSKTKKATYATGLTGWSQSSATQVPDRVLSKAEAAGIDVYVGLQVNDDWWTKHANDVTWLNNEATVANGLADELYDNYGAYDSFAGWYLPFEVDNVNFPTSTEWSRLATFYSTVANHLHTLSPGLPVVIAPFFNANLSGAQTPAQWQTMWTSILASAPIDVIALQDGVGAGHATATQLASWFSATRNAINASRPSTLLIDDAETFLFGASGLQPMPVKDIVADMAAVTSYVDGYWSFAYDHYQSPQAPFSTAYDLTYKNYLTSTTVETTAPGTPTSLSASATSSQNVTLSWTAPSDNIGVAGYHIYRNGALVATEHGAASGFTDRQLTGSTTYAYAVKAFDGAGNLSASSSTVNVTTPAAPSYATNWAAGKTYTSTVAANASYPDTGGTELTDGVVGAVAYGPAWQGRNAVGTYSFTIDLGASRTISSISSRWLQVRSDYVFLPDNVTYAVSANGTSFTNVASIDRPAVDASNQIKAYLALPATTSGRYVKVTVNGGSAWSMLDEVEARS